jgi:hypothetical protein
VLALIDVLLGRNPPYQITPKVRTEAQRYWLVWAHLPVVTLIVSAWGIGVVSGRPLPPLLHLWAAVMVLASLGLMWTETWTFPAPYDKGLWESQAQERLSTCV